MANPNSGRLKLEVTLMDNPCLWRWDIKDPLRDEIIASSWEQEWTAYPSRDEAYRAGNERLRSVHRPVSLSRFGQWRFGASD